MYLSTEAVVLSRRNFGEADRIITLFTRDHGKITVLAKGVRRPRSKKAGHLELGSWCKVFIARGKNLDLLTEVELKRAFGINEFSENKANKIYHLLEIIKNITAEGQKNQTAFIILVHFLKQISSGEDFNLISSTFKIKLLSNLGFFTARQMPDSKTKKILTIIENEPYDQVKKTVKLTNGSYLKLLGFLDSMIEELTERKLNTVKFISPTT